MNPDTNTYWTALPIVYRTELGASLSSPANHANPVATMIGPSRLSGRACHDASPLPSSEAPTTNVSTGPGSVGRSGGTCVASQTAAPAAAAPAIARR